MRSPVGEGDVDHVELVMLKLVQLIREEFEEAPGLRLTVNEGAQFWGLDATTCEHVFARLLGTGFLARDFDQRYRQT